jgi:mono/diheme cytochrome c family protein
MRPILTLAATLAMLIAAPGTAGAQAAAGADDIAAGKSLHEKDCVACHARRFNGDATQIYLRADRKVRTPAQLAAQISYCNTELNAGYFPDDEAHVGAYLARQYYKFAP